MKKENDSDGIIRKEGTGGCKGQIGGGEGEGKVVERKRKSRGDQMKVD